jgi:DNA-binding transcriptional LysR family regulator
MRQASDAMRGATLRQLKAFSLVARHQSFVRAAAELHLTPPAVSMQIKDLEQALGLPLFDRNGKGVALTRAGELLLVDVHRALQALQDAEDTLTRLRGRETGVVSVGMVSNAKYFLPRLLALFHERHRDVRLHLAVGNREQLVDQLRRGLVDLAVMGTPPPGLDANAEAFATQPLGIVAAPEHPLNGATAIPVAALAACDFIVREPGSGTRAAMDRFFRDACIEPPRVMEMTSNEAIKQAVIGNMGLAFLSLHTVGLELRDRLLVAVDVVGLPLLRRWFVVGLDAGSATASAQALRRFIGDEGGAFIARQFDGLAFLRPVEPVAPIAVAS